jgi:hypothetical protein
LVPPYGGFPSHGGKPPTHSYWIVHEINHPAIRVHLLFGGFNHLEKYESQWEGLSHILWEIKNVPNHQI